MRWLWGEPILFESPASADEEQSLQLHFQLHLVFYGTFLSLIIAIHGFQFTYNIHYDSLIHMYQTIS